MAEVTQTNLTEIQVEIVVEKAVKKTLRSLGVDLEDVDDLREFQADFLFMRKQRKSADKLAEWLKHSAVVVLVGGALAMLWHGLRAVLTVKGAVP